MFALPVPSTEGSSSSIGDETKRGRLTAAAIDGEGEHRQQQRRPCGQGRDQQHQRQHKHQQNRTGVALAFHSSFSPLGRGRTRRTTPTPLQRDSPSKLSPPAAAEGVDGSDGGPRSVGSAASSACTEGHADETTISTGGRGMQGMEAPGAGVDWVPGRFGYSLGKPFHSQRVACARFVVAGAPTLTPGEWNDGVLPELRLVTGKYICLVTRAR